MAFEREYNPMVKDISSVVELRINQLNKAKTQIRITEESKFADEILNSDMPLSEQLDYRKAQILKEEGKNVVDKDFIRQLKSQKASLNKRFRAETYRNSYYNSSQDYIDGTKSSDDHLTFLQDQLSASNDTELRMEINNNINQIKRDKRQETVDNITNSVTYAQQNPTKKVIDDALALINKERIRAMSVADTSIVTLMNTNKVLLERELKMATLNDEENNINTKVAGGKSIDTKMDWINGKVSGAGNDNTPFFLNGVKYDNESDFWEAKKISFVSDPEAGYFKMKQNELDNQMQALYNTTGDISLTEMSNFRDKINKVYEDPNLAQWKDTLGTQFQQDSLTGMLDKKIATMAEDLQKMDSLVGISEMNDRMSKIQELIPEISRHAEFAQLSTDYATKARTVLNTRLNNFLNYQDASLGSLTDAVNDSNLSQEDRDAAQATLTGRNADLSKLSAQTSLTDLPLGDFGFGVDLNEMFKGMIQQYDYLAEAPELEGVSGPSVDQAEGQIEAGNVSEGLTNPNANAPAPTQTAPSTSTVSGSANFEKDLATWGDEDKKKTMAGWGYQWKWSDQGNQVGGWIPASEKAKQKYQQNYGEAYSGNQVTLGQGGKKLVAFGGSAYTAGLLKNGWELI